MKTLNKISLLLITFLAISCSKNEDSTPAPIPPSKPVYLIKTINYGAGKSTFLYDTANKLISQEVNYPGFSANKTTVSYNINGKIYESIKIPLRGTGLTIEKISYLYDGTGKLIEKKCYSATLSTPDNFLYTYSDFFSYTANTFEFKRKNTADNFFSRRFILEINSSGNIFKSTRFKNMTAADPIGIVDSVTDFEFDSNNNPLKSIPIEFSIPDDYTSNNNIVKITNSQDSPSVNNLSYEYNTDGYPTKRTSSIGGGVILFEYQKL